MTPDQKAEAYASKIVTNMRVAQLLSEAYLAGHSEGAAEVKRLRAVLEKCAREEVNGYKIDKLLNDLLPLAQRYGGWQNCYAINAVIDARTSARSALRSGGGGG